jgi:hypothetical protein
MAKKVSKSPDTITKPATLFDHLEFIQHKKRGWDELTESDKKTWSTYMINRYLSMSTEYIDLVNMLQRYTIGMNNRDVYKLYLDLLPAKKQFLKYVKGKSEDKYSQPLIDLISNHFKCSSAEAIENIELMSIIDTNELPSILKKYGKSDKEIAKLLKDV